MDLCCRRGCSSVRGLGVWSLLSHLQSDADMYSGVVNPAGQAVYLGVHESLFNLNIWNLCT